jgi:ornithine decarboxylase/arginine decarboxylase
MPDVSLWAVRSRPRSARHHRDAVDPQAAGEFSQASQIHIKDRHIRGQKRRIEHRRFNESFMQHASTSPFYPLFASLDVGAQMMKGRSGEVLWDDTIRLGIELRRRSAQCAGSSRRRSRTRDRRWFFEPFVPDRVAIPDVSRPGAAHNVAWETLSTDELATNPACGSSPRLPQLARLSDLAEGFAMTDPNKLMLLTPGFDRTTGAPMPSTASPPPWSPQYLRENRIVPREERPQLAALPAHPRRRGRARPAR